MNTILQGLPIGAVKNALQRDGHDPEIMDLDHNKSVSSQLDTRKGEQKPLIMKKKPKVNRKKVYWTEVEAREGTIWSLLKKTDEMKDIKHDNNEFESLFTQTIDPDTTKTKKQCSQGSSKSNSAKSVKVIDAKRGMNGDIILRKLKVDPFEMANMVEHLNCGNFDATSLRSLYEFMPTNEEIKALTNYIATATSRDEALNGMTPCEQYMVAMKDVNDSAKKLQCMIFLAEFKTKMKELKWEIDILGAACEELKSSKRFRALLGMILKLVNQINTGGKGKMATGFTLDTLSRIGEVRSLCIQSTRKLFSKLFLTKK